MTCWERYFKIAPDLSGMDELYKSLTSSRGMSAGALSDLLHRDVSGNKVQTRIALDGHDIEIRQENGIWRVLQPTEIKALNSSQPTKGGVSNGTVFVKPILSGLLQVPQPRRGRKAQ